MTILTEAAEFIRQQINNDERWANAANQAYDYADEGSKAPADGVHWTWAVGDWWEPVTPDPVTEEFVGENADSVGVNLVTVETWPNRITPTSPPRECRQSYFGTAEEVDASAAGHIVNWDPHRVLATVAANRALLDWLLDCHDKASDNNWWTLDRIAAVVTMAAQWRGRPGWREEWLSALPAAS